MSKPKTSFDQISKLVTSMDMVTGMFVYKDPPEKPTLWEKFLQWTMPRHTAVYAIFVISTLIITNCELISIIILGSLLLSFICCYVTVAAVMLNKSRFKDLIQWCENCYIIENYHKAVQGIAEAQLIIIEKETFKRMTMLRKVVYLNFACLSFGFVAIGFLLPFIPKGIVPLPVYFILPNQETWIGFLTTVTVQTIECLDTASFAIYLYSVPLCVILHVMGYLDMVMRVIDKMKQEMFTDHHERETKSTLELETLKTINESSVVPKEEVSFDEWMKILNDMISNVNSVISSCDKLYANSFLLLETASLGSLFIGGMCLTVLKQQEFFAVGINVMCVLLFIACYLNELMLEKMIAVNVALYNLPWWELNPKQGKQLKMLMHCDKIQQGITASGIHKLTVERFGIVVKAGYTNLLVLKDLVQK